MTTGNRLPLDRLAGHMWIVRWIGCGLCDRHEELAPIAEPTPTRQAIANGWRKIGRLGWLCPACTRNYEQAQAEACTDHRRRFHPPGENINPQSIYPTEPQPTEL